MCVHIEIVSLMLLRLLISARRRSANVGCIVIHVLAPSYYDPLFTRRTPFLVTGWASDCDWEMTTYHAGGFNHDLRVLETNRQIYQEASTIYYSQNMFYAGRPSVLVPFLKDRGSRTRSLIRKLSVGYPSSANESRTRLGADDHGMYDSFRGDLSMWEDVCCYISLNMPGLAQLDLRNARFYPMEHELAKDEDYKTLQTKDDFSAKQREVLATIGPETELTVSDIVWSMWEHIRPNDVLFSPVQRWLRDEISQLRVNKGLNGNPADSFPSQASKASLASFWKEIRSGSTARSYTLN